jgi:hypothetical protein
MHQTPTPIWNEIAATQKLLHQPWKRLFGLTHEALGQALTQIASDLEAKGCDSRTIRAYLLVAPLLAENEAISSYVEATERPDLRSSMPELVSLKEALTLAVQEYRLMPSQLKKLKTLLLATP